MEIKAGSVIFLEAQDHEAKNIGKTTIDLIMMELKKYLSTFFSSGRYS